MKRILLLALGLLVAFAAVTWWALESGGVAVVETRDAKGAVRSTHVWYAKTEGELWLEAGTPENPWFVDVQGEPLVVFHADGGSARYEARISPEAAPRVRQLLREKYGFRDRWVGLLVDPARSVAVQLLPVDLPADPPADTVQ